MSGVAGHYQVILFSLVHFACLPIPEAFPSIPALSSVPHGTSVHVGAFHVRTGSNYVVSWARRVRLLPAQELQAIGTIANPIHGEVKNKIRTNNAAVTRPKKSLSTTENEKLANLASNESAPKVAGGIFDSSSSTTDPLSALMDELRSSKPGTGEISHLLQEAKEEGTIKFSGKTYTAIITACKNLGRGCWRIMLDILNTFRAEENVVDAVSICKSITLQVNESKEVKSTCLLNDAANVMRSQALISRYRDEPSRAVLEELAICYGEAISACLDAGGNAWNGALQLLSQMQQDGLSNEIMGLFPLCRKGFSTTIYGNVIKSCAQAGEWRKTVAVLESMGKDGAPEPDVTCFNSAIIACQKGCQWEKAGDLIQHMSSRGIRPNSVSYGAAFSACARAGRNARLMSPCATTLHSLQWQLYHQSTQDGIPIAAYMIRSLADACARVGDAKGAVCVLDAGILAGVVCDDTTLNALLLACARAKDSARALQIFGASKRRLLRDERAMSTLLGALASGGQDGLQQAERMVAEAEADGKWSGTLPAACYFNLLEVAHEVGDKSAADRISSLIRARRVSNKAAIATFELHGHRYTVDNGDTGNGDPLLAGAGHQLVRMLREKTSYSFNLNTLLVVDASSEAKVETLSCHAEKTALGTLLLRSKAQRANAKVSVSIRMCRDCHSAFEHASQLFESAITCDDGATVHEFRDGRCSCSGTWR